MTVVRMEWFSMIAMFTTTILKKDDFFAPSVHEKYAFQVNYGSVDVFDSTVCSDLDPSSSIMEVRNDDL